MTRGHRDIPADMLADERSVYQAIGPRLKAARERRRMYQQEVANLVGLTRTSIANIEAGHQGISLPMFLSLADALGVEPAELLT